MFRASTIITSVLLTASLTGFGCGRDSEGLPGSGTTPGEGGEVGDATVACWASWVYDASSSSAGSESGDYAPEQATGYPDTQSWADPECVDSPRAWSPEGPDWGEEYIVLGLEMPLQVDAVDVFENLGAGSTAYVALEDSQGAGPGIEKAVPADLRGPEQPCSVLTVGFDDVQAESANTYFDTVVVVLNTADVPGYNEIDAVAVYGNPGGAGSTLPSSCESLEPQPAAQ